MFQHDPLTELWLRARVRCDGRARDQEQLGGTGLQVVLLLGHRVRQVGLGVDFDRDDGLVEVHSLTVFCQRSVDVPVGCLDGLAVEHGQDAGIVDEHRGRGDAFLTAALQTGLDSSHPDHCAAGEEQGDGGTVGRGVRLGRTGCRVIEGIQLAVVDAGVDTLTQLA